MKHVRTLSFLCAAVAALATQGCGDESTSLQSQLFDDSTVTLDVASSAGDAVATSVQLMIDNESAASMPGTGADPGFTADGPTRSLDVHRDRTCYDAAGAEVSGCSPMSSVRKVVTHVTVDGTRSNSNDNGKSWTGAVHLISNDTLTRVFNSAQPPVETARTHNDLVISHDTTTFTSDAVTRFEAEAAHDSVKGISWNLPRSQNPWPASGSVVRVDSIHVGITKANASITKDIVRTVEVDFPADAQGNVVLKINARTCNLNLVNHLVTGCHQS